MLLENLIKSYEGSIDEKKLDDMIRSVIKKFEFKPSLFDKLKPVVIADYEDSDISKVTPHDIVEIIDASGFDEYHLHYEEDE